MSVFTNPAGRAPEDAAAYVTAVLGLLGNRDPREVLASTLAELLSLIRGLDATELATPEAEGKWSMAEVLQHLADSELVWGYRMRRVLAEERPVLTGYDQDLWASRLRYANADVELALGAFEALRAVHLRMLGTAREAELARCGVHAERGEESLAHMVRLYAGHDLLHLAQLARIRRRLRPGEASGAEA